MPPKKVKDATPKKLTLDEQLQILRKHADQLEEEDAEWWNNLTLEEQRMPKIELHAHLSGSLPLRTVIQLLELHRKKYRQIQDDYETLVEYRDGIQVFDVFPLIHKLLITPEAIEIAMRGVIKSFAEEACVYLEIRTTPKETKTMNKEIYLRACLRAIKAAKKEFTNIKVFLIVSVDVSETNIAAAASILEIVHKLNEETNLIVGIDVCGKPIYTTSHLLPVLMLARKFHGLGVTAHLGELPEIVPDAWKILKFVPDRIGHGTYLMDNEDMVDHILQKNILFEICLTSNQQCGTVQNIEDTHAKFWRNRGNPIAICTDDQGIFPKCSIMREYKKAMEALNLTLDDMIKINKDAMDASFAKLRNVTDLSDIYKHIELNYVLEFENVKNFREMTLLKAARAIDPHCKPSDAIYTITASIHKEAQLRQARRALEAEELVARVEETPITGSIRER